MISVLGLFFSLQIGWAQQGPESYDCRPVNGDAAVIHLEDSFSPEENMRMGSLEIQEPGQDPRRWNARVYQFLMPDNERYLQMWYVSSDLRVDGQFSVFGGNGQFAATFKNLDVQLSLHCRKK